MGEYAEYGFDQQGWYGMFVACGIWCLADVSSISPSSEQYTVYFDKSKAHLEDVTAQQFLSFFDSQWFSTT